MVTSHAVVAHWDELPWQRMEPGHVARPAGTRVGHSFRAGAAGLTLRLLGRRGLRRVKE